MLSSAVAGFTLPLLVGFIDTFGWRDVLFAVGVGFWIVGIPAIILARRRPEDYGQLPDGDAPTPKTEEGTPLSRRLRLRRELSYGIRQALRTPFFWQLGIASSLGTVGKFHEPVAPGRAEGLRRISGNRGVGGRRRRHWRRVGARRHGVDWRPLRQATSPGLGILDPDAWSPEPGAGERGGVRRPTWNGAPPRVQHRLRDGIRSIRAPAAGDNRRLLRQAQLRVDSRASSVRSTPFSARSGRSSWGSYSTRRIPTGLRF